MDMRNGTRKCARSGITAVLAMLYLTLMASLALGFYSASNTAVIVSDNEQKTERTRLAAESGLDFARFELSRVSIPAKALLSQHFSILADQMAARLNGSGNLDNGSIYSDPSTIRVPADPNKFIKSDEKGAEFQFTISSIGDRLIRVVSVGRNVRTASVAGQRVVRLDFELQQNQSKIFSYGIATMGTVSTSGSAKFSGSPDPTKGSILSLSESTTTPVVIGGKLISGDISVTNPNATVAISSGASVGGTPDPNAIQTDHVHRGVDEPEFPTVDTSMFIPYATNMYVPGKTTYSNIIIPPNTNPSFNAGTVIKGVVYVKTPNKVSFNGHADLQGVIVTDTVGQVGNLSTNTISFSGGFGAQGVETLDASYGDLRLLTGSFMLLPGFSVNFTGNFGAISGTIVVDKASFGGSSSGTLNGSLIILKDTPLTLSGSAQITAGQGTLSFPAGLKFSNHYVPQPWTYDEVKAVK